MAPDQRQTWLRHTPVNSRYPVVSGMIASVLCLATAGCGVKEEAREGRGDAIIPVEAAAVEHGFIEDLRTYSGTLESPAQFIIAPKIAGRIDRIAVDIGDQVEHGQVLVTLDDDEYRQAVAQAEADLNVARANRDEAASTMEIAERELERIQTLRKRGVVSEADLDAARAAALSSEAAVKVAEARIARDEAALAAARIRLGYTELKADWNDTARDLVVAARYSDEGDAVAANTPLLSIVQLDPLKAVFYVTEREYAKLSPGQPAGLATAAWEDESFPAAVARVAPVFREDTRQARVEMTVANASHRLKPGMFVRATVSLEQVDNAAIVPVAALASRDSRTGVFVISPDGNRVNWLPVKTGINEGGRVQLVDADIEGRVVTLGQQLLDDDSAIKITETTAETSASGGD